MKKQSWNADFDTRTYPVLFSHLFCVNQVYLSQLDEHHSPVLLHALPWCGSFHSCHFRGNDWSKLDTNDRDVHGSPDTSQADFRLPRNILCPYITISEGCASLLAASDGGRGDVDAVAVDVNLVGHEGRRYLMPLL